MMPMYEFLCGSCGEDFEKIVASAEAADRVECPGCGSREARRKLSLFASSASGAAAGASTFSGYSAGGGCGGACSCQ